MQEALVLSVLLQQEPGQVVVLDEPAVNLEPTVQRRLLSRTRGSGQCIVITHSADLVPVDEPDDLQRIVRVAPGRTGSQVRQPQFTGLGTDELFRQLRLLEPTHVRGLLFARAVILCEGPTEVGALPRWWRKAASVGLPDPQAANIPVISVDGDSAFGAHIRYLDAFGVPWAVIADGPALRPRSKLAAHLRSAGHWPDKQPDEHDDFAVWREFWEGLGVFTLADQFGDDGSKGGEFEAYLQRVDQGLLADVEAEIGKRHKPRVGAYFAVRHPEPPTEILSLYRRIAAWLGIEGQHSGSYTSSCPVDRRHPTPGRLRPVTRCRSGPALRISDPATKSAEARQQAKSHEESRRALQDVDILFQPAVLPLQLGQLVALVAGRTSSSTVPVSRSAC